MGRVSACRRDDVCDESRGIDRRGYKDVVCSSCWPRSASSGFRSRTLSATSPGHAKYTRAARTFDLNRPVGNVRQGTYSEGEEEGVDQHVVPQPGCAPPDSHQQHRARCETRALREALALRVPFFKNAARRLLIGLKPRVERLRLRLDELGRRLGERRDRPCWRTSVEGQYKRGRDSNYP